MVGQRELLPSVQVHRRREGDVGDRRLGGPGHPVVRREPCVEDAGELVEVDGLGIEDLGDGYMASVEFSGLIREEPSSGPSPFREVWNMTKLKDGRSGWLVAGVQALQ